MPTQAQLDAVEHHLACERRRIMERYDLEVRRSVAEQVDKQLRAIFETRIVEAVEAEYAKHTRTEAAKKHRENYARLVEQNVREARKEAIEALKIQERIEHENSALMFG